MDTISLKNYIFETGKIKFILNEIGCKHIQYHPNKCYYSCSNFNGDNPKAINVKNNEYLNVVNWTRVKEFGENSDIITLVQYNKNMSFINAVKYLHKILGLEYQYKKVEKQEKKYNPLETFERIANKRRTVNVDDIKVLEDKLLDDFIPMLHIDWYKDGIMPWTRKKFGLAYSYKYKRVIIPMRYWLTGELLGFNQRTTIENYEEFGVSKYFITPTYPKLLNLYGLYENYDDIQKAGYVVVYEAERSVLKRDSLNDPTGVALSGHSMSEEQIAILIGLNVDIVISMDKDVAIEEIRHLCSKFYNIRNVYYTYDSYDLLDEKESVADKSNKIFNFFMKHKIEYNKHEHELYLDSLKKNKK